MSVKKRIKEFCKSEGITITAFESNIGVSNGYVNAISKSIGLDKLNTIIENYSNLNIEWLLTGKGDMIKSKRSLSATPTADIPVSYRENTDFPAIIQEPGEVFMQETRPRIPFDAAAGSLSITTDAAYASRCEQLPVIPIFPHYDFTIFVTGDSMQPDIKSGDELACRFIRESSALKWGEIYVLDTNDGVVVKSIYEGDDDTIVCHSLNPRFKDFSIGKQDILRVARVIGLVRRL